VSGSAPVHLALFKFTSLIYVAPRVKLLLSEFNLLVSTSRGNERNACSEIWYLLRELGDSEPKTDRTSAIGLVVAKTKMDPIHVVRELARKLVECPWKFRYILKVSPVEKIVPSSIAEIDRCVSTMAKRIGEKESFRITVRKRHTTLSTKELVDTIAKGVDRKVDLDNPDKVILIEIIGELAGVSVISPSDVLSVEKAKRSI
jgi:tRNA acetyltransferase TAN1